MVIYVTNIERTVFGYVTERNLFIRSIWKEVNIGAKLPRVCAQEVLTEHELTPDFWQKFKEVTKSEYNNNWGYAMEHVKYNKR